MTSTVYVAVYHRSPNSAWPEDIGDDPSFVASRNLARRGGVLTWGVCRQDVRNRLCVGDLVIFFATDRPIDRRPEAVRYTFVGFATVARKISQVEIWRKPSLAVYCQYSNLLIRADGDRFEHFEPGLPRHKWHGDWYWRMARIDGHRKTDFDRIHAQPALSLRDGLIAPVADNYVLFAPDGDATMILQNPPMIATAKIAGRPEVWEQTAFARELRDWLQAATHRSLRTTNAQRAHRHITIRGADIDEWRAHLRRLCHAAGLRPRTLADTATTLRPSAARSAHRVC
jgi:hypothetical protein